MKFIFAVLLRLAAYFRDPLVFVGFSLALIAWLINALIRPILKRSLNGDQSFRILKALLRGAFALAIVLVLFGFILRSFDIHNDARSFALTVYIRDSTGRVPLQNVEGLVLYVRDDPKSATIDRYGAATFKDIPWDLRDSMLVIALDVDGWIFPNNQQFTKVSLLQPDQTLVIQHTNSFYRIYGRVESGDKLIPQCELIIDDTSSYTNSNGFFNLTLPPARQKPEYNLIVIKAGFKKWEQKIKMPLVQEVRIILEPCRQ